MLHRVIGAAGSGKTEYILERLGESLKKGKRCIVIVPEQQSVDYEALLCDRFGDSVNMLCELLNFERLPNRIARDYGDLAVNNIDKGGACALLSLISESLKDNLSEYSAVASDADFAQSLFMLISRMKMALVTPQSITDSLSDGSLADEPRLAAKLRDIALIYSEYEKYFGNELFDPRDALTRLANELPYKPFFENTHVFIDSYYTFTEQEYSVIKQIISQCGEIYISFTAEKGREFFYENQKASERVAKLAHGKVHDYYMPTPKRPSSKELSFIERNIWQSNAGKLGSEDDGSVRMISAKNRFDEVEAAAAQILEFVRSGNRYRDITVLTNNTDTYSSIVDSVFTRAGIPCYMSAKEEIATKPLFSFLLSSLSVIIENFSLRSIKRYIKSGYTDLTSSESDILLNYAASWNLRGKAWYSEEEWMLDPEGYREGEMSKRAQIKLKIANKARNKVVGELTALHAALTVKDLTVSQAVRALYTHITTMRADEKLRITAEKALNRGDREAGERDIQLWKILINIFDQLDSLCGDRKVTPKRLQSLIMLMCGCYSLGAIPASADSVTFGSASLIRAGGSKMVVILGVCDGEFPASASTGGFFDRAEASALEDIELYIADTMEKQLNTARFFVYSAFAAPGERLVLLCPRAELTGGDLRPSTAWLSVKNMLPNVHEMDFRETDMLYSAESIAANFPSLAEGQCKSDIESALMQNNVPFYREFPAVTDQRSRIDYKEDRLKLSPSKFETYIKCPFSFFGQYVLGLQQKKQNEFSVSEIGNFVHKMLDMFMRECTATGKFIIPDENERVRLINKLADDYLQKYIGIEATANKQFMHIYSNMVKTVIFVTENICEEFAESKFTPTGFEFRIGMGDSPDIPAIEYDSNGRRVYLRGSIDRVDVYEKDGVRYVRVVDYKTYAKDFSVDLVAQGLDTQLLHYLFAYCNKTDSKPAGALYYTVTLPEVKFTGIETDDEIKAALSKELKRNGIILDDYEIADAMNRNEAFLPVEKNDSKKTISTRKKQKIMYTAEEFDELSAALRAQVENLADNVFCGNMDIQPKDFDKKADSCKYCPLGEFCRSKKLKEDDDETD